MNREHKIKIIAIVAAVLGALSLIGLLIYFVYSSGTDKKSQEMSSNNAIGATELLESYKTPEEYLRSAEENRELYDDALYATLFSEANLEQMKKLRTELGYRSELNIDSVELISEINGDYTYRLTGTLHEYYDRTNEEHTFPASFVVVVKNIDGKYIITSLQEEDDVDDV